MKIVLHPPVDEDLCQQVRDTAPNADVVMADDQNIIEAVADAEIIFGNFSSEIVNAAPNLKWIQSTSAGMDKALIPRSRQQRHNDYAMPAASTPFRSPNTPGHSPLPSRAGYTFLFATNSTMPGRAHHSPTYWKPPFSSSDLAALVNTMPSSPRAMTRV